MENTTTSFLKKLADFKAEPINIPKDKKAYGYNYAPLDTILPIIEPLLKKHGLGYFHTTGYDKNSWKTYLETVIYETETESKSVAPGYITSKILIDEEVVLAKMNKYMVIGSALTYFRRYHLVVMLGLLTDEDTDAGAVPGTGRSVESAAKEVDYTKTFKGLIEKGQTEKQILAFYKNYEKNFNVQQAEDIMALINDKFSKK